MLLALLDVASFDFPPFIAGTGSRNYQWKVEEDRREIEKKKKTKKREYLS